MKRQKMNKVFKGLVIKRNEKTTKVLVVNTFRHKKYNKELKREKTYIVHDKIGSSVGDVVEIAETKPISKLKKFKLNKILEKNDTEI